MKKLSSKELSTVKGGSAPANDPFATFAGVE